MFYNDITVSCRAVNGLKPGALTAITAPPAASSPGLVPFAVWLQLQKVKKMLIQQMCPVLLGAVLVFPAFFPHCCIYGSMSVCTLVYRWRLLTGLCKVDAPSTLHTSILCEGDALKKKTQLCNQLDFYCEFYHYFYLPAITSVQVCALTLTAVSWIIPPITDVWIRSCSWCFKGFKGVFVSL